MIASVFVLLDVYSDTENQNDASVSSTDITDHDWLNPFKTITLVSLFLSLYWK